MGQDSEQFTRTEWEISPASFNPAEFHLVLQIMASAKVLYVKGLIINSPEFLWSFRGRRIKFSFANLLLYFQLSIYSVNLIYIYWVFQSVSWIISNKLWGTQRKGGNLFQVRKTWITCPVMLSWADWKSFTKSLLSPEKKNKCCLLFLVIDSKLLNKLWFNDACNASVPA